jgi:pyrroline-5-carboxylate reductase
MTTAVIGTGVIGSVIARELASGGETLRLSSADHEPARMLAAEIGRAAVVAAGNRDALQGADAIVLALRPGYGEVIARFASGEPIVRYEPAPPMAGTTGDIEALSMWAGQSVALARTSQPAAGHRGRAHLPPVTRRREHRRRPGSARPATARQS